MQSAENDRRGYGKLTLRLFLLPGNTPFRRLELGNDAATGV
jgi:hypothetical protein